MRRAGCGVLPSSDQSQSADGSGGGRSRRRLSCNVQAAPRRNAGRHGDRPRQGRPDCAGAPRPGHHPVSRSRPSRPRIMRDHATKCSFSQLICIVSWRIWVMTYPAPDAPRDRTVRIACGAGAAAPACLTASWSGVKHISVAAWPGWACAGGNPQSMSGSQRIQAAGWAILPSFYLWQTGRDEGASGVAKPTGDARMRGTSGACRHACARDACVTAPPIASEVVSLIATELPEKRRSQPQTWPAGSDTRWHK